MRWDRLFADLEAQLEREERAELASEVADRTRREVGRLRLVDRLRAGVGAPVALTCLGAGVVHGVLRDVGPDWALVEEVGRREALVALAQVLAVSGVGATSEAPEAESEVVRRLDLRHALRGLVRDRAGVQVVVLDGSTLTGTLDRVGADHVDLALHAPGEVRRAEAVREVQLLPLSSLVVVRSAG